MVIHYSTALSCVSGLLNEVFRYILTTSQENQTYVYVYRKVLIVAGFCSWCQHQPAMTFLLACVCSGCLLKPAGWVLYIGSVFVQVSWSSESVGSSDSWSPTVAFLGSDIVFRSNWLIVNCNIPWCHRCSIFMCFVRCSAKGTWDDDLVVFVCAVGPGPLPAPASTTCRKMPQM